MRFWDAVIWMGDFNSRCEAIKATTQEERKEEKYLNFKAIEEDKFEALAKSDHLYNDCFGEDEKSFKYYLEVEN